MEAKDKGYRHLIQTIVKAEMYGMLEEVALKIVDDLVVAQAEIEVLQESMAALKRISARRNAQLFQQNVEFSRNEVP